MGWEYVQRASHDRQVRGPSRALLKGPFETSSGKCYRIFRTTSRSRIVQEKTRLSESVYVRVNNEAKITDQF